MADKSLEGRPPTVPLHHDEPDATSSTASQRQEGATDVDATEALTTAYSQTDAGKSPAPSGDTEFAG